MNASWRTQLPTGMATRSRRIVWLVTSLSCVGVGAVANAQTTDVKTLEEIIVTAQKRAERLQDVPISITALSGVELDRSVLASVNEELNRVPGVAISDRDLNGAGGVSLSIRGVTAAGSAFAGASPIAYYVDSLPFGFVRTAIMPDMGAYDLDRIEVLRGPQGTLYGAGGSGGVVRVLTRDADLDEYEFKARSTLSSVKDGSEGYRGDLAANIPIVQGKLAARAVIGYEKLPGWIDSPVRDDINEGYQRNLRLKVNAQPTDKLSIGLSAWNTRSDADAMQLADDDYESGALGPQTVEGELDAYNLTVEYQGTAFDFTSMTSYVDYSAFNAVSFESLLPDFFTYNWLWSRVYSQEFLLSSNRQGPWRWSAGVFYRDGEDRTHQRTTFGPFDDFSDFSEQSAVFGEVGRRFWNDKLEWALGLRYFHDNGATKSNDNSFPNQANAPTSRIEDTFEATTPRAVLSWFPNPDLTVYGTYGQGFRSGTQQTPIALNFGPYQPAKPDKLHNYEVGAKGMLFDQRLAFDVAFYYIDWEDTQQLLNEDVPNSPDNSIYAVLLNATSVSGPGFDIGLTARPLAGLEVSLSYSRNSLEFDEDLLSLGVPVFSKGDRLANSPAETFNPSFAYTFPFGASGLSGQFAGNLYYTSAAFTTRNGAKSEVDSRRIVQASFAIEAGDRWSVRVYADNLNDYVNEDPSIFPEFVARVRPRTIGMQFEYRME
jgi:iron complex outermembrane recepter protein